MTLLGRDTELRLLAERRAAGTPTRLVGAPGIGRRALLRASGLANDPRGAPVVVGPLALDASVALLRRELTAHAPERDDDDDALATLALRLDGVPLLLELGARHAAMRGPDATLRALDDAEITELMAHDPRAVDWTARVDALADGSLAALAIFAGRFDEAAARAVAPGAADDIASLVEQGLLLVDGSALRMLAPMRRRLRARPPADPERRARHAAWTLAQRRPDPADLREVFEEHDGRLARRAGARLASYAIDRGPVQHHLARLIALHAEIGDADPETERALATLHLILGEPEIAWRRIEPLAHRSARDRHVAANVLRRLGRDAEAERHYEQAIAALELEDDRAQLGRALSNYGGLAMERGDVDRARALWRRALRCFARDEDPRAQATTLGDLGLLDHESGALDDAEGRYRAALAIHEAQRNLRSIGIVSQDLGELLLLRGSPLEARKYLARAVTLHRRIGDARQRALAEAALAFAALVAGDADGARARLDALRDEAPDDLRGVMTLYRAALRLASVRAANARGDVTEQKRAASELERDLDELGRTPDEARRVAKMIAAELARARRARGWTIAADGGFVVTPDDERIDLSRKHVWRRLVQALLERRLARPGDPLSMEQLVRLGWPEQRTVHAAARNRLHVALSGIRKAGLEPLLVKTDQGYLLDPDVDVVAQKQTS
ncbi:MAG: tetratricopeptide repeat protein [Sandaracinaceae bacterium]